MNQLIQYFIFILSASIFIAGCSNSIFNTEPFADSHFDEQGNVILEDTPRMWQDFTETVEFRIMNELAGKRPEAGKKTWNEFWIWRIQSNFSGRENKEKYINYIIERRRQEGLPELEGYPE